MIGLLVSCVSFSPVSIMGRMIFSLVSCTAYSPVPVLVRFVGSNEDTVVEVDFVEQFGPVGPFLSSAAPMLASSEEAPSLAIPAAEDWTLTGPESPAAAPANDRVPSQNAVLNASPRVGTPNVLSGDRLSASGVIESNSGLCGRASRVSAPVESTVDGGGKVRGQSTQAAGFRKPSLQTALVYQEISGEVLGGSEQFAGISVPQCLTGRRGVNREAPGSSAARPRRLKNVAPNRDSRERPALFPAHSPDGGGASNIKNFRSAA